VRLVVLDIVMPEMGGRVASERIRALGEEVPFIFMSGYTMSALDSDFVQDAGRRFLPKPFNGGQLLREVRAAIT
jgi:CheY-like chemotaxis protein